MKEYVNLLITVMLLFEAVITILVGYINGWESIPVGIGLLIMFVTSCFIRTEKGIGEKVFLKSDFLLGKNISNQYKNPVSLILYL